MRLIIFCIQFIFLICCGNKSNLGIQDNRKHIEDFDVFYSRFFQDSTFQRGRINLPLKGSIKYNDGTSIKKESWDGKEVIITPKKDFFKEYKNLTYDLIKSDTLVVEKMWIKNSGFSVERYFKQKSGKWYLDKYNINNF